MRIPLTLTLLLGLLVPVYAQDDAPPAPRKVELETESGDKLAAEIYEPTGGSETKPAVIVLHGQGGSRADWASLGPVLAKQGVTMLAVDLRGHGESVEAGGVDVEARIAAGDPVLFGAMRGDALAALAFAREELLADGRKLGIAGIGVGASIALEAAKKDDGLAAVLCIDPDPAACGVPVAAGLNKWDGRPVGLLACGKKSPSGMGKLERLLKKQPRTESLLFPGKTAGADLLAADAPQRDDAAQWLIGWLLRPDLDGKPGHMQVKESSGPGHIVAQQSSCGLGMGGAGGLSLSGYRAPQEIDSVVLMAHSDPESTSLDSTSRRLTFTRAKGKEVAVNVKIEVWGGKKWKKHSTTTMRGIGGFSKVANVNCFEIWLPPHLIGVRPFTTVATTACFGAKGKPTWKDEDPFKGKDLGTFGGPKRERKLFKVENPSTWSHYGLR